MSETQFEPEVLALLDEIARSPEGRLLHVPRQKLPTYFGDPRETLTPHGSFQSKAERHLITAYREQAARVLLEACIMKLKRNPQVFTNLERDEKDLQLRAKAMLPRLQDEPDIARTLRELAGARDLSITELAVGSVRLCPCDLALNVLAACYQRDRWYKSSLRVLERFYDGAASNRQRAQAFAIMASAYTLQGDYWRAFQLGSRAATFDNRSRFAAWCLTDALQGGDEDSAVSSAQWLDRSEGEDDLPRVLMGLRLGRANGAWTPTPESQELIPRVRRALSPRSRSICDEFS